MPVRSLKGKIIDFSIMMEENKNTIAVTGGGQLMNARGDLLDKSGKILKTREELLQEYNKKLNNPVKEMNVPISSKNLNKYTKINNIKKEPRVQNIENYIEQENYIDISSLNFDEDFKNEEENIIEKTKTNIKNKKKLPSPPDEIEDQI